MADLGITRSHSRAHVPDDNPLSDSQIKVLKYHPGFPDRFGSIEDARAFCRTFFVWYNAEHRHIALGRVLLRRQHRDPVSDHRRDLGEAKALHERFQDGRPERIALPRSRGFRPAVPLPAGGTG